MSNEAGHISASTLIKIISFAPKFTEPIQNKTVYSDSNIELSCGKVDGSPKPKITWTKIESFHDNTQTSELQLNDDSSADFHDFNNNNNNNENGNNNLKNDAYLRIRNVNQKHQGWYKCEASNILGKVSASMFLQVKSKHFNLTFTRNVFITRIIYENNENFKIFMTIWLRRILRVFFF